MWLLITYIVYKGLLVVDSKWSCEKLLFLYGTSGQPCLLHIKMLLLRFMLKYYICRLKIICTFLKLLNYTRNVTILKDTIIIIFLLMVCTETPLKPYLQHLY